MWPSEVPTSGWKVHRELPVQDLTWQAMDLGTRSRGGSPGCQVHA